MSKIGLGGLPALLVLFSLLVGCSEKNQSQIFNITGPTPVTGGDGGGNPTPAPTPTPTPSGAAPGSFTLSLVSCTPAGSGQNEARITFGPSSGAVNYRVERRVTSVGDWISQGVHAGPTFSQIVGNGAKVWYSVVALNSHGEKRSSPFEIFACDEVRGGADGNGGGGTTPPPTTPPPPPPPPTPTDPPPTPPAPKPTVSISANPSNIERRGDPTFLNWNSQNATSCVASEGWTGNLPTSGVRSVTPLETKPFCVICSGAGGFSERACVEVKVKQPPPPTNRTIDFSPAGGSGKSGTTLQLVPVCRENGQIVSCSPYWFSSRVGTPSLKDASRVSVNPNTGLILFVGPGKADICGQWSRTIEDPRQCYTYETLP